MYHANVNVDLIKENVFQINGGKKINVHMSERNVMGVKQITFGNLLHVVAKMRYI